MTGPAFSALVLRVRAEFLEMPGLTVTFPQAMRLWGVSSDVCQDVIDTLVSSAFLQWTPTGRIVRAGRLEIREGRTIRT
jgi:hypothetical protein